MPDHVVHVDDQSFGRADDMTTSHGEHRENYAKIMDRELAKLARQRVDEEIFHAMSHGASYAASYEALALYKEDPQREGYCVSCGYSQGVHYGDDQTCYRRRDK
jgi:predicted aldo/keto reductase-like oxidoreductase